MPIESLAFPGLLHYPMYAPVHAPTQPFVPQVQIREKVRRGDVIAVGASLVHAAAPGIVVSIAARPSPLPDGRAVTTVSIETSGADDGYQRIALSKDLAELVYSAGIVGLGGAGYPTHLKLRRARELGVTTVMINAAECEPGVSADQALLEQHAEDVVLGALAVRDYLGAGRVVVGIEHDKHVAIAALKRVVAEFEIANVQADYPTGAERTLIAHVFGELVPRHAYPTDHGIIVLNVATAHAIHRATRARAPLMRRIVTLGGKTNVWVPIGCPLGDLPLPDGPKWFGGPLTGWPVASDASVTKTCNSVALDARRLASPCIRCGWCADACPESLLPQELYRTTRRERWAEVERFRLDDCIECGACDEVCPSHIPLLSYFRYAKTRLGAAANAQSQAHDARGRYLAREARIAARREETSARRDHRLASGRSWD